MGKRKSVLKKSTVITMVSCVSFVVMTFLALLFFVKFPITPSERMMSGIGRKSIYRNDNAEGLAVTQTTAQTQTTDSQSATTQTTTVSTRHSDFVITVTTGKGFRTSVRSHEVEYDADEYVSDYSDDNEEETTEATDEYEDDYSDGTTDTEPDYDWSY